MSSSGRLLRQGAAHRECTIAASPAAGSVRRGLSRTSTAPWIFGHGNHPAQGSRRRGRRMARGWQRRRVRGDARSPSSAVLLGMGLGQREGWAVLKEIRTHAPRVSRNFTGEIKISCLGLEFSALYKVFWERLRGQSREVPAVPEHDTKRVPRSAHPPSFVGWSSRPGLQEGLDLARRHQRFGGTKGFSPYASPAPPPKFWSSLMG